MSFSTTLALAGLLSGAIAQDPPLPLDVGEPVTSESGLVHSVLVAGPEGASPDYTDTVHVHYTGWLLNGKVFDSSRERGEPASFRVGGVVEGWNEALRQMTPGARWKLTIPAALAYGEQDMGDIPPNSTLVFDLELLGFEKGPGLPEFRPLNAEKATQSEAGYRYEVLEEGTGEVPAAADLHLVQFTFWNEAGERIDSTLFRPRCIKIAAGQMKLPFLNDLLLHLKPGATVLCDVPDAASFQGDGPPEAGTRTFWVVNLVNPLAPDFSDVVWQKTASGLEYKIVAAGTGDHPAPESKVRAHYSGWLENGKLFDSSSGSDPIEFSVRGGPGGVIAGWVEGVQMIGAGGEILLRIPPDLAYGPQARGPIPANATLHFRVRLESLVH